MDTGVAALLGAAVGGLFGSGGTLGAAFLSGRLHGKSQHEQWRREGRREAYSGFIAAATAFRDAADEWEMATQDIDRVTTQLTDSLEKVSDRLTAVRAAAPVVAVEGPKKVAELADKLDREAMEFAICADLDVEELRQRPGERRSNFGFAAHNALGEIMGALANFTVEAREALDSSGPSRSGPN